MKMASYECGVILLLLSLCWGSALHSRMYNELQNDDQTGRLRGGSHVVKEQSCPTWHRETKHNLVNKCVCGDTLRGYVMCDYATLETLIFAGFCISYKFTINDTVIGRCPFNYHHPDTQTFYTTLPNDTSELNSFMCNGLNQTGLFCSQCQQGLGPIILSYKRECVKCLDKRYGWLVYITATLIPTTILCFIVIIFKFHVTSAEMNAFVFLCQFVTSVSTLGNSYIYVDYDFTAIQFFQLAITTFYAIWNLDFFQFFIPSFCISSDMSTLHTLSLDYVVAIYPLLLTVIIYFCIEMYDSRVRVVVCVWSPFQMCLCSFQKEVGLQEISDQCFCCFSAAVIFKAADSILQFTGC